MTIKAARTSNPAAAWALLAVLFLCSVLNTSDRAILNFLVGPIRHDLQISDVQISLLQGLSFSLCYALAGLPLGFLADRTARTRLLTAGILLWSGATIASGLAPNFKTLFICRMLVGIGEATLPPCAISLLSDSFTPAWRGRSMSLYLLGGSMATGLAGLLVGWILTQAPRGALQIIPGAAPWRLAMIAVGGAGGLVAIALTCQREPPRHGFALQASGRAALREVAAYLAANAIVFRPLYLGFTAFSIATYGILAWAAPVLTRQFGLTASTAGKTLGLAFLVAGMAGALLAGQIVDHRRFLRGREAKLTLLSILPFVLLPAAAATLAPGSTAATLMLSCMILVGPMVSIVMLNVLTEMMPNDMRALSVALLGLAGTMIGGVLGPLLIATCTQHILGNPDRVGQAMLMVGGPCLVLAATGFWQARSGLRRSLAAGSTLAAVMRADRPLAGEGA
jgi:MFS family permease